MLKTLQILKFLKQHGVSFAEIHEIFQDMVDNERSEYFELTSADYARIRVVFENDVKFASALNVAGILAGE